MNIVLIILSIIIFMVISFGLTYTFINIFYKIKSNKSVVPLDATTFKDNYKSGQLIDVRTSNEYHASHIPGARNISLRKIKETDPNLIKDKPIYLYCAIGKRSKNAGLLLRQRGYTNEIYDLKNGLKNWNGPLKIKNQN